jgi:hypothetical protein
MTEEVSKERLERIAAGRYVGDFSDQRNMAAELLRLRAPTEARGEPVAWMTTDHTGCRHISEDRESIASIADGSKGLTPIVALYASHPPAREAATTLPATNSNTRSPTSVPRPQPNPANPASGSP